MYGVAPLHAQEPEEQIEGVSLDDCRNAINLALAKEQRLYRSTLFGEPEASEANIGHVRYSNNGDAWIKTDTNTWRSVAEGFENTTWRDVIMDEQAEFESTTGIFATKRMLTSELIPYMLQSMHALQCRGESLCELAEESTKQDEEDAQEVTIQPEGCIEQTLETFPACHFAAVNILVTKQSDPKPYCLGTAQQLLAREAELLKLAVEYDAAYRTMLQLAGNMELFIREFRWPLTFTVRRATTAISNLGRIPCFLASCDDSPTE